MTKRTICVTVLGDVQGVGFRWFARERARALNLGGWARNIPSGDVEVIVGGESHDVERFVSELRKGPPRARVKGLQIRDAAVNEKPTKPFDIR